ncbi:MAG TPA: ABC transporter substrate-binding protein [Burkholderiaceae bacterium]|nr:ABC transporter substrate-binding protein [Burkholderiaceae bacterium]
MNRRRLLTACATGSLMAAAPALRIRAQPGLTLRIGAVLPLAVGQAVAFTDNAAIAAEAARRGAVLGAEEHDFNAQLFGHRVELRLASAPTADAARRAAQRLMATERVFALIGGLSDQASALRDVAAERGALFMNIGSSDDRLRSDGCARQMFHVEASAAMYVDSIAAFFVRAGLRRWLLVAHDDAAGQALLARARATIRHRHWGLREVGQVTPTAGDSRFDAVAAAIAREQPQLLVALLPWHAQLDLFEQLAAAGIEVPVTGLPDPVAQTRAFFDQVRTRAPAFATGRRVVLWEHSLDRYGARELNDRFHRRWGAAMDAPAWAAYQAMKILSEAATGAGTLDGAALAQHLAKPGVVFDVHKGIGVSFRPWDRQLRQPLYLVRIQPSARSGPGLAVLEGELPAIHQPGTDPLERLDQIGERQRDSRCRILAQDRA